MVKTKIIKIPEHKDYYRYASETKKLIDASNKRVEILKKKEDAKLQSKFKQLRKKYGMG